MNMNEDEAREFAKEMSKERPLVLHEGIKVYYLPGLLPDFMIEELCIWPPSSGGECSMFPQKLPPDWKPMIEPFELGIKRPGVISYGLTSTGYDVRLGNKFKVFTNVYGAIVDPKNVDARAFVEVEAKDGEAILIPGNSYLLGETVEYFRIPRDITVLCVGKSTYARCGIIVNVTPGEPEWEGRWTVEISNSGPTPAKVYAGEGIMQCLFFRAITPCRQSYKDKKGKYQGDQGLRHATVDEHPLKDKEGQMVYASEIKPFEDYCRTCNDARVFHPVAEGISLRYRCGVCGEPHKQS